ncbi:MAG: zeta toxin family protein [Candidatus Saccharimonadales bacterium]
MDEHHAKLWVKDKSNQRIVLEKCLKKFHPTASKIAIFMAGIPGAGKTEFVQNTLMEMSDFIPIEHDALVEFIDFYQPENYYKYRSAGSVLVSKLFDECIKHGYDFIFDGTLSHEQSIRNIRKTIHEGYRVNIIYIVQDKAAAWQLTQAREQLKKRAIERKSFLATCHKINKNLLTIFREHKDNSLFSFWIIDKRNGIDSQANLILHNSSIDHTDEIENILAQMV